MTRLTFTTVLSTVQFITTSNTKMPKLPLYHCTATQSIPEYPELYRALCSLACTMHCYLEPRASLASHAKHPPGLRSSYASPKLRAQSYTALPKLYTTTQIMAQALCEVSEPGVATRASA